MKKTLIALAAVAAATAASAQVTVSGEMGFGFRDDSISAGRIAVTDGGLTFSANEDLGGGLSLSASQAIAFGAVDQAVNNDGTSIEIKGGFGAVKFYRTNIDEDALGVGSLSKDFGDALAADSVDKTYLLYTLPSMVPNLTAAVRWGDAGGAINTSIMDDDGKPQLRLGYKMGDYAVAFNTTSDASELLLTANVAGATVKFFTDTKKASDEDTELSISFPVSSALTLAASYGTRDASAGDITGYEFDAQYALSKRTMIRASVGSYDNASNGVESATQIKLYTTF